MLHRIERNIHIWRCIVNVFIVLYLMTWMVVQIYWQKTKDMQERGYTYTVITAANGLAFLLIFVVLLITTLRLYCKLKERNQVALQGGPNLNKEWKVLFIMLLFNSGYIFRGIFDIFWLKTKNLEKSRLFPTEMAHMGILILGDLIPLGSVLFFHMRNFKAQPRAYSTQVATYNSDHQQSTTEADKSSVVDYW